MSTLRHLHIGEFQLSPGEEWTDTSAAWRFVRVASGDGYWLEPFGPRFFRCGEVAVVEPGPTALVRASQVQPLSLYAFCFSMDAISGFFTLQDQTVLKAHNSTRPALFLPSTHPVAQEFAELCVPDGATPDLLKRAETLCMVISFFVERPARHPGLAVIEPPGHSRFQQIIGPMPEMQLIQYAPEALAGLCGCSPRHFLRLFRKHFGVSLRERRTEVGLNRARQLLEGTDTKIHEVALDCGYRSMSLFNLQFKRRFGITPSALREQTKRTAREGI